MTPLTWDGTAHAFHPCRRRGCPRWRAVMEPRATSRPRGARGVKMLWTILVVLLVLWAIGLVAHVGGALIHLLLVIAAVLFLVQLLTGRRAVVEERIGEISLACPVVPP